MKYESCSYIIHKDDLEIARNLANELELKLNVEDSGVLIDHGVFSMIEEVAHESCYKIWFDEIEVNSFKEGDDFEEEMWWKQLQERSMDAYLLKLLNS